MHKVEQYALYIHQKVIAKITITIENAKSPHVFWGIIIIRVVHNVAMVI